MKNSKVKVGDIFITNQGCIALVIGYKDARNVLIEFQDDHKHQRYVYAAHLKAGKARNPFHKSVYGVGYHGVGSYEFRVGGIKTPECHAWSNMLTRCYDPIFLNERPTYRDCYVCDEWLNYQNFAEWYVNNPYYGMGYELDKDLLIQGNKVYSPDTCLLIPQYFNKILIENTFPVRVLPTGVCYDKSKRSYAAQITMRGDNKLLGRFKDPKMAEVAYIKAKDNYVRELAQENKNVIDSRLYEVLMSWSAANRK